MRSTQRGLIWILLAAAVVLALVAVVSAVLYLVLRQVPGERVSWADPMAEILPEEIQPDLALYPLAGASELETVDAAIANGDLETAYAGLVFGSDFEDGQRIGRLVVLGGRFAESEKLERAARAYFQVQDLAVLSPGLTDPARADALLAAGKGWTGIGRDADALLAFDQAHLIAVQSPYLQMANRRELLTILKAAYSDLGQADSAAVCLQQIIRLDQETHQPPAQPVRQPDLPKGDGGVSSPEVGALEEARRQAAFGLVQSWSVGGQLPAERIDALTQALREEDAAKMALYRQELESTTQPGKRIDVLQEMVGWLTLKYRVATRGFGLSLVPEWEAQAASIQSDLSKAYEDLYFDYEDLVTALPDASLMGAGSYAVRRQTNLAGRLGQYPNYPDQQLAGKLRDGATELIAGGAEEQLFVDALFEGSALRFFLNLAGNYGQPPPTP